MLSWKMDGPSHFLNHAMESDEFNGHNEDLSISKLWECFKAKDLDITLDTSLKTITSFATAILDDSNEPQAQISLATDDAIGLRRLFDRIMHPSIIFYKRYNDHRVRRKERSQGKHGPASDMDNSVSVSEHKDSHNQIFESKNRFESFGDPSNSFDDFSPRTEISDSFEDDWECSESNHGLEKSSNFVESVDICSETTSKTNDDRGALKLDISLESTSIAIKVIETDS